MTRDSTSDQSTSFFRSVRLLGAARLVCYVSTTLILGCATQSAAPQDVTSQLVRLDHVALHVKDLSQSVAFYKRIFNFETIHEWDGVTMIGSGTKRLGLFLVNPSTTVPDPDHSAVMDHFAFVTTSGGLAAFIARLDAMHIPHTAIEDIKIAKCVFLNDPDGFKIEVLAYYQDPPPLP